MYGEALSCWSPGACAHSVFLAGVTKLSTVPIELLKSALKSVSTSANARLSYSLYGRTFCDSSVCNPSFFQILFEAHSHELTTAVFAGEKVIATINTPLDAFVTAWCLSHSDPTSSWNLGFVHSLSSVHFQKQLRGSDCLSQGHQHGSIAGLLVGGDNISKILPDLPKLHPCTQQMELIQLQGSRGLEADEFATRLSTLYPNLKHLQVIAPQWLSPVLCKLHELTSLTSFVLRDVSSAFYLPLQQCPSIKSMLLNAYIPSLVLPNMNTLEILILNCPLTSAGVRDVCRGLCQTTSLKHIVLDCAKLSLSGAKDLAAALTLNKTLEGVWVRDKTIGDEGVRILKEALNNHSTVKLLVVKSTDPVIDSVKLKY